MSRKIEWMEDLAQQAKDRSSYITQHKGVALGYFVVLLNYDTGVCLLCMIRVN